MGRNTSISPIESKGSKILLMEGFDPACVPDTIYVRQGKKVCFFAGGPKTLSESLDEGDQIVESLDSMELVEREDGSKDVKDGVWEVEGVFQRWGVDNANKRRYAKEIWDRHIADGKSVVQRGVADRSMLGHLEHPADGRTDGKQGSILVTKLEARDRGHGTGIVWGRAEILDTPNGSILKEYTKKRVKWGVSSRGTGSVDADGNVDEKNYNLITFDAVMSPSVSGANPTLVDPKGTEKGKANESVVSTGVSAPLSADAESITDRVRLIAENPVPETVRECLSLANEILDIQDRLSILVDSQDLSHEQADALRDWLMPPLKSILSQVGLVGESRASTDESRAKFQPVVDTLTEQIRTLSDKLEAAQTSSRTLMDRVAEMTRERDTARSELRESRSEAARLRGELVVSRAFIRDMSETEVLDPVSDHVEKVVRENPVLEDFADVLSKVDTIGEVNALAARFSRLCESRQTIDESSRVVASPVLPSGNVNSEATIKRPLNGPVSRGARMASRVLARSQR